MGKIKKRKAEPAESFGELSIGVDSHEAFVTAGINHVVYAPQNALRLNENERVYQFLTRLVVNGTLSYPEERKGEQFRITLYGDDGSSAEVNATLKDVRARDKYGAPRYKPYRGGLVPVYEQPPGLGLLEKVRGQESWHAWLQVSAAFASDALRLLGRGQKLYVAIGVRKIDRVSWVRSLSLQTVDPLIE